MGQKGIRIKGVDHLRKLFESFPIKVESAFLFGSRARGDFLEESDWDILIVSPEFAGLPFPERASFVLRKAPLRRVELLCYTPEEFHERLGEIGIVSEAAKGFKIV